MTKLSLTRMLRLAIALVLLIVTAVIFYYFFSHRRPRSVTAPPTEEMPAQKVEQQEGIEHFDYKGDRVIRAKAKRHYAGEDGRYYLDGNVEIRDLGRKKGEEIALFGQKVSYDKDWADALLEGEAKLQYKGLTAESSSFSYHKNKELLSTEQGVVFSSEKISGKAQKMAYSFKAESMRLEGGVELVLRKEEKSAEPFIVRGDVVTFMRKQKRGTVEGDAFFSFAQSRGWADSLLFILTPDEQSVRGFFLKGNAQAVLVEQKEVKPGESKPNGQIREITADEVDVRAHKEKHQLQKVDARGRCILKSAEPEGQKTEVRSDRMKMLFDGQGALKDFSASGKASLVERKPTSEVERTISGEEITLTAKGRTWNIKAPEGGEARVDSPDSDVTAQSVTISPRREVLEAEGGVKVIVKLRREEGERVAFFSRDEPVLSSSQKMRYDKKSERLQLEESVRMWQGKQVLFADRLTVLKKTGELTADGKVRATFSRLPKSEGASEEKIEIGGESLGFSPQKDLLNFEKSCSLLSKEVTLNSDAITVFLKEKTAELRQIEANGSVTFAEKLREGKGEKARYDLDEETIVLTGNPTIIDKEKGVIKGEKLTFRLGEGRIQVENKDRERSTTVIKS
jgi:lipopolysaccharide transport protein LptA